jgi:hypothetical protein
MRDQHRRRWAQVPSTSDPSSSSPGLTWRAWTPSDWSSSANSLRLDASATARPEHTGHSSDPATLSSGAIAQRPSLAAVGDSVRALVAAAGGPAADSAAIPVRIVYTEAFLLTVHSVL